MALEIKEVRLTFDRGIDLSKNYIANNDSFKIWNDFYMQDNKDFTALISVLRIFITTVLVLGVSYLVRILSAAESKWPLGPRMKVG